MGFAENLHLHNGFDLLSDSFFSSHFSYFRDAGGDRAASHSHHCDRCVACVARGEQQCTVMDLCCSTITAGC